MADNSERRLTGGFVNDVWRVGDTVRRSAGAWTPAVHGLLDHLESVGFPYSPRVLGFDEHGREVLTFIEGVPGSRPWPPPLRTDEGLRAIGRVLRELAAAVETFTPPEPPSGERLLPDRRCQKEACAMATWECGFDEQPDLRHRLSILSRSYGTDPAEVLGALAALQATEHQRVATLGAAGIAPFTDFLARGDLDELDAEAAWLAAHRPMLID